MQINLSLCSTNFLFQIRARSNLNIFKVTDYHPCAHKLSTLYSCQYLNSMSHSVAFPVTLQQPPPLHGPPNMTAVSCVLVLL